MRYFLRGICVVSFVCLPLSGTAAAAAEAPSDERPARRPNVIIIFADDLGYGDLRCYGHPTIATPHLDRMASEGMRFTQFYVAACVCTPSRAALLTGRLPIRNGMCSDKRRVLFPDSVGGLPHDEVTIAESLKPKGYACGCVGKWHLGHLPKFLPTEHGFDQYFGIPYSNDMKPAVLMRDKKVIEEPVDQTTLTKRYTDEAISFIRQRREQPFLLYFAHTFPHVPLFASDDFLGTSRRGLYGDVVEELDWSVGRVLDTLRELKIADNTLVFFTSDNGPWLVRNQNGGSAGLLRGGKGSTWEGGMREPAIAWWPGHIPAGRVTTAIASSLDLLATIAALADADLPDDRTLDSLDLSDVLFGGGAGPRDSMFYYRGRKLMAVRSGPWKAHFMTQAGYRQPSAKSHDPPLLFHLENDPSERHDLADKHPKVIAEIRALVARHESGVEVPNSQLELRATKPTAEKPRDAD